MRIEDTDRARSTDDATAAIFDGLRWLGLDWDDEAVSQFANVARHQQVARELLARGQAYRCYCTPEELAEMRDKAKKAGGGRLYDGRWRDRDPSDAPEGIDPVIRLKAPLDGETTIEDMVQGPVTTANGQLDDMILLRADGTPTYMLAVVVDDHDMGITHVIRGDDHLTNAFRQSLIFDAMGWERPRFAHIPLIHGPDGAKMSKRHGALGVDAYRDQGFLPDSLRNYLLRLGWAHGDEEIISTEDAVRWFSLDDVGRSPSRFDFDKLNHLNAHYLRQADNQTLCAMVLDRLPTILGDKLSEVAAERVLAGLDGLKPRAKTLVELSENAAFYASTRPIHISDDGAKLLCAENRGNLRDLAERLATLETWNEQDLDAAIREFAKERELKLGAIAQPVRAALTGAKASPGIFEIMVILGRDETLGRIADSVAD